MASGLAFALLVTLSFSPGTAHADTAPAFPSSSPSTPGAASPAPRPRRIGLIVGGATTFGVTYGLGVLLAFASLGSTNEMCPCPTRYNPTGYLVIPVVGPWIGVGIGSAHGGDTGALALLGILQATGVALTVGGIVRYVSDGKPEEGSSDAHGTPPARSRPRAFMSFGVLPTRDGAFGFLSGRM